MDRFNKIRFLIRLAELCGANDAIRKQGYMDEIDSLLKENEQDETEYYTTCVDDIMVLFDFNSPKTMWRWILVSELYEDKNFVLGGYSPTLLGRRLSNASRSGYGVRRKHSNRGSYYYLPPFKRKDGDENASNLN